ncbi:BTB/POZ domain protein, partial [Ostertagia ostertagi]
MSLPRLPIIAGQVAIAPSPAPPPASVPPPSAIRVSSLRSDDATASQPKKLEVVSKQATKVTALSTKLEWKIDQFEKLMKLFKNGQNLISRQFGVPQAPTVCWELHVYPNGKREEDMNNVSFFLRQVGLQVSRDKMAGALRADGSLLLICEVEYFTPGSKISVEPADDEECTLEDVDEKVEMSIRESNREMWESELFTDCVIKVGSKEIKAHRCVLGQHSPVFRSMFNNESMIEAREGIIDIQDAKYESVRAMVEFMYTGSMDTVDSNSVDEVLAIADKYEVLPLKEQCERIISNTITQKNITSIAVFADTYTATLLKQAVIRYLTVHHKNIIRTPEWRAMKKDRYELANELLEAVLSASGDMDEESMSNSSKGPARKRMDWRVVIITYNVNMQRGDEDDIEKLLAPSIAIKPSLLVIGMQEVSHGETVVGGTAVTWQRQILEWMSSRSEGLVLLTKTYQMTNQVLVYLRRALLPQEVSHGETVVGGTAVTWQRQILEWMSSRSEGLVLLTKTYQMTNQVLVYLRRALLPQVRRIQFRFIRNTMGGLTGHKGSIGVNISLHSGFSIVFVESHFIHDVISYDKRIAQFHSNKICCFPEDDDVKATFWLGDLNFRVDKEPEEVVELIRAKAFSQLLDTSEQLKQAIRQKEAFDGFKEQPISFPPTYRFYVGSTEYDLKRTPSWCDRVLFRGDTISPVTYISNENVLVSDHIPVQAVFDLKVPGSQATNWDVLFEHLPPWYTTVPLISRFQFRNNYWSRHGSYLDWAAVYPVCHFNELLQCALYHSTLEASSTCDVTPLTFEHLYCVIPRVIAIVVCGDIAAKMFCE